ncbi:NAD(P)H-quinone oxidoreductase [Fulvivirga sp. M361]|uniref:NAD(P)H-quinone oxidoreductase n=1 Tax=Fulvivirga sp. M361 TaxID=2594266 RepID=UPI00117B3D5E|nr:NAD(P)H-quinone oxidoreductase [Fulvivirga sp. M361]TRX48582.1 NAD(P)H-quinone oxidoreductase [Fulvivirga sp. M361]
MKAILLKSPGRADNLYIGEAPTPQISNRQLLIKVRSCGVNRADILQREGKYPPPKGESPIIGLEVSGVVEEVGGECERFQAGDHVVALLAGGGYAEYVAVDESLVMPVPAGLSFEEAAGIAEVFITAYQALFYIAKLEKGQTALIHAGASGVGTAAIQLCHSIGAKSIVTAGSTEKIRFCEALGASSGINYRDTPAFDGHVLEHTGGKGADVIIDPIGASYFDRNLKAIATDGRWVLLAAMGGAKVPEMNLGKLLVKRVSLTGSTLRSRDSTYKARLVRQFSEQFLNSFESGALKPVIDQVFPWEEVAKAHRYMEQNRNTGKIILSITRE